MKRLTLPAILPLLLTLLFAGCDSAGSEESREEDFALGAITAQIDGREFSAASGTALLVEQEEVPALPEGLSIVVAETDGTLITISLYPFEGEDAYTVDRDEHAARVTLPRDNGEPAFFSTNLGGVGVVEVTERTEEKVRGTFRFTASGENGDALQVTDGRFHIALLRGRQEHQTQVCGGRVGEEEPEVFMVVEQMPELIGGMDNLQERLIYPAAARAAGIEGRVFVQFTVGPNGEVANAVIQRSVHGDLDAEALRLILTSAFRPGTQRGWPVCVRMSLPVSFRLE